MARIAYDMDGTLIGVHIGRDGREHLIANRRLIGKIKRLRHQGHTLILWTYANRAWLRHVEKAFPILPTLFHETYTVDEVPAQWSRFRGRSERVKDLRRIRADVLVDNEPQHGIWGRAHGIKGRYVDVETYGDRQSPRLIG